MRQTQQQLDRMCIGLESKGGLTRVGLSGWEGLPSGLKAMTAHSFSVQLPISLHYKVF